MWARFLSVALWRRHRSQLCSLHSLINNRPAVLRCPCVDAAAADRQAKSSDPGEYQIGLPLLCTGERKERPLRWTAIPSLWSRGCRRRTVAAPRARDLSEFDTYDHFGGQMPAPGRQGYVS
jgi:hypothetical protein